MRSLRSGRAVTTTASIAIALVCFAATTPANARGTEPTKKECVNANESGQDLRQAGKLREARAALAVCMSPRCPRPVREDCAQRLAEIEAALPTLVFVAKDGDGNDLQDVRVSMDGKDLTASDGTAVAINPGDHAFTFTKEGLPSATRDVVVREGDKDRRIQVTLAEPKPAPPPAPIVHAEPATSGKETRDLFGLSPGAERGLGLGIGVAGILGIGAGTVFGLMSKSTYDRSFQECHGLANGCDAAGAADNKTGFQQAGIATAAFIAGGALTAAGVVLYVLTPSSNGSVSISPTVGARDAGLTLTGRF